jgi:hypothetical protein
MNVAAVASVPVACDVCGLEPCLTPGFCQGCRAADAQLGREPRPQSRPRSTPQTLIEAIMWCIRERDPRALREPANIERLLRCDLDARTEINNRIASLLGKKEIAA